MKGLLLYVGFVVAWTAAGVLIASYITAGHVAGRTKHSSAQCPIRIAGCELSTMAYGESQAQCLLADSARGALHRF